MAERKNTGLAVSDAKRLNECFNELSDAIAARPPMKGDRQLWRYDYAALPGGPETEERLAWNHRCGSKDIAFVALRGAMTNDNLQLWTNGPHGEAKIDRYELKEPTFKTFASGTYQPDNRRLDTAGLADSPLWVKEADWDRYMADLWSVRYGIDWANPAPPADKPLLPPEAQFVTLSHALTWIAFGVSMDSDQLHEVLTLDLYGEHDPQEGIKAAVVQLVERGRAGRVAMEGKYRESHGDEKRTLLTAAIEPIKFANFRQFNYLSDELRHGEGLTWWRTAHAVTDRLVSGGRADSFIEVDVNRADLLREFRPHGAMGWEPEAIQWSDLEPAQLARVKELAREAEADEWWNWPQALAWVGGRSVEHVATMRLCAEQWRGRDDHQFDVALGAERYLAQAYCGDNPAAEDDLQRAIERGAIRTLGRSIADGPSRELKPGDWRGGKVVYNRTATLVSSANLTSEWAYDVALKRADLMSAFPSTARNHAVDDISPASRESTPEKLPIWLNPYQLEAWVQYRDLAIVAKAGDWNGLAGQRMYGDDAPTVGSIGELIEALQGGQIPAQGQKNGETFQPIAAVEWSRISLAPLDLSRQHPYERIHFHRDDVLAKFPALPAESAGDEPSQITSQRRKTPGPDPDPDWPGAIMKVTADCIAAGYTKPLKRGDKAAIQNLLLSAMAEKDKHPSDDTARKYAEQVIVQLPDNSG